MGLIERLEQAARDCDAVVARSLHTASYDQTAADYRGLLLEAAAQIRSGSTVVWVQQPAVAPVGHGYS